MPSSLPLLTMAAAFSSMTSALVWYGSSVTTIQGVPPVLSTISATARMRIEPRPVR